VEVPGPGQRVPPADFRTLAAPHWANSSSSSTSVDTRYWRTNSRFVWGETDIRRGTPPVLRSLAGDLDNETSRS
jgi:hypothetical protein